MRFQREFGENESRRDDERVESRFEMVDNVP